MEWLISLFTNTNSVAHIALLYSIVIAVGVLLGKIKIAGVSLGVTFVLFAGIIAGHIGFTGPTDILTFVQDFGLILFVFCIGLQVGPGFFESFRKGGVTLNLLSTAMIFLNIAVSSLTFRHFFFVPSPCFPVTRKIYHRQCHSSVTRSRRDEWFFCTVIIGLVD